MTAEHLPLPGIVPASIGSRKKVTTTEVDIEERKARRREYQREYQQRPEVRARQREYQQRPEVRARQASQKAKNRTFVGVDGEGWTDADGHHHYMLLVAGDQHLYTGEPLSGEECRRWIWSLPKGPTYVGFYFGYDVTMILRDLAKEQPERMLSMMRGEFGFGEYAWFWKDGCVPSDGGPNWSWGIQYRANSILELRHDGKGISIADVRSFFQCSFVRALERFQVGTPEEMAIIKKMKAARSDFDADRIDEIMEYCKLECKLLAELVSVLANRFGEAGISLGRLIGPGDCAGRVLRREIGGKCRDLVAEGWTDEATAKAWGAFSAGRIEITAHGRIHQPVWVYDINSAYPDAMTRLPCLSHGVWHRFRWTSPPEGCLWFGHIHDDPGGESLAESGRWVPGGVGQLPWRAVDQGIRYPLATRGWYWSIEATGCRPSKGWWYEKRCDCQPFHFVPEMYERRRAMEAERKGSGIGFKLSLNSMYGKLCQKVGAAPHANPVWGPLITAMTRARLYKVCSDHPGKVVMCHTDSVTVTEECPELEGHENDLGGWSKEGPYNDMVIVETGFYFQWLHKGLGKCATKGIPYRGIDGRVMDLIRTSESRMGMPPTKFQQENLLGLRLGLHRGGEWIDKIGDWLAEEKTVGQRPHYARCHVGGFEPNEHGTLRSYPQVYPFDVVTKGGHPSIRTPRRLPSSTPAEGRRGMMSANRETMVADSTWWDTARDGPEKD